MFPIMAMSVSASPEAYLTRHTFMAGEKPQVSVERSHLPQTAQIPSRADDCHLVTISGDLIKGRMILSHPYISGMMISIKWQLPWVILCLMRIILHIRA